MAIKIINYIKNEQYDELVKAKVYTIQIKIRDYLEIIDLATNPYQRNVLGFEVYAKLIRDLLNGALIPPISVVYDGKVDLDKGFSENTKLMILDGLQRTNCLLVCKEILEGELDSEYRTIYPNKEEFLDRPITLEVWEGLDLRAILYKIIVLNTGQKKMDTRHQLDIMISSLKAFLKENKIKYIEIKDKQAKNVKSKDLQENNIFPLHIIAEGIVAYINTYPQYTPSKSAEFLFNKFDIEPESYSKGIKIIEDPDTYDDLVWVLKDLSDKILAKYGYNVFIKYSLFFSSFLAALSCVKNEFPKEHILERKNKLMELVSGDNRDPLDLDRYMELYNQFESNIGVKRRKLVYNAFRNFFFSSTANKVEWFIAHREVR